MNQKIHFDLTGDPDSPVGGESVWAERVGDVAEGGLFRVDNVPFFARRVCSGDVVVARPVRETVRLPEGGTDTVEITRFVRVETSTGKKRYLAALADDVDLEQVRDLTAQLAEFGATVEGGMGLLAVEVVPADAMAIEDILLEAEEDGVIEVFGKR